MSQTFKKSCKNQSQGLTRHASKKDWVQIISENFKIFQERQLSNIANEKRQVLAHSRT